VPVDRRVGIGLVGPRTERPAAGVCARSFSMPRLFVRAAASRRSCVDRTRRAGADFFLALSGFAAGLLRPLPVGRLLLPAPRDARAAELARVVDEVRLRPGLVRFREEPPAFRRAVFFAIVLTPVC
jgi:hypothetical protein